MPYKEEDWRTLVIGLETIREWLALAAKSDADKKSFYLSQSVHAIWSFGEYAINVVLELGGDSPEQNHRHSDRAIALAADGRLAKDYSKRLGQLEKYRLKATHKGYSRGRSVHYSSSDVENCLDEMCLLQAEVESLLRAKGKLS